jgi:hydrogenase-4 membrane subunit HyfE
MVAQRWIVTNIRAFAVQSFLLADRRHDRLLQPRSHICFAAFLTLALKAILLPVFLERLVMKIEIRQEIEPFVNIPSVIISGLLTLLAYVVAESFHRPEGSHRTGQPWP